jgi:hypothetical protein
MLKVSIIGYLTIYKFLIDRAAAIQSFPDATELCKGSKRCSLKLVKKMSILISSICKFSYFWLDGQLHLAQILVFKSKIYQYIIGSLPESIFNSNYLYLVRGLFTHGLKWLIEHQYLRLSWWALTSHQVSLPQSQQVWRSLPILSVLQIIFPMQFTINKAQSMYKFIQIRNDIGM